MPEVQQRLLLLQLENLAGRLCMSHLACDGWSLHEGCDDNRCGDGDDYESDDDDHDHDDDDVDDDDDPLSRR